MISIQQIPYFLHLFQRILCEMLSDRHAKSVQLQNCTYVLSYHVYQKNEAV